MKNFTDFVKYSLNESLSDIAYHFTYTTRIYDILNTNEIHLTPLFGTTADLDINSGKLYALSLTSSKSSNIGYAASLPKDGLVRITLDGRALNQNYKSKRVDYWQYSKDPKNSIYDDVKKHSDLKAAISRNDELEDRIISDNDTINNASKFITNIDILVDDEYNKKVLGNIKRLCEEGNIELHVYNDNKSFNASRVSNELEIIASNDVIKRSIDDLYYIIDLIALLLYKNDSISDKFYSKLSKFVGDVNNYKKVVAEKNKILKRELYYDDDYKVLDKTNGYQSYIHNNKSSNNKVMRFVLRELGLDMKKSKTSTIKDYIKSKIWKNKKTFDDLKIEFVNSMEKEADRLFQKNLEMINFRYYDIEGEGHDNLGENKELLKLYKKKLGELKAQYKKVIFSDEFGNFKYTYLLSDSYVEDAIHYRNNTDYNEFADKYLEGENIQGEILSRVITIIPYDLYNYLYDLADKLKDEYWEQWKS